MRDWSEDDLRMFTSLLHRFVDDTESTYTAAMEARLQETGA